VFSIKNTGLQYALLAD